MANYRLPIILVAVTLAALSAGVLYAQSEFGASETAAPPPVAIKIVTPKDFVSDVIDTQLFALSFIFANSKEVTANSSKKLDRLEISLRDKLDELKKEANNEKQQRILNQAGDSLDLLIDSERQARKFKSEGNDQLAEAMMYGNVVPYATELQQIFRTLEVERQRVSGS